MVFVELNNFTSYWNNQQVISVKRVRSNICVHINSKILLQKRTFIVMKLTLPFLDIVIFELGKYYVHHDSASSAC